MPPTNFAHATPQSASPFSQQPGSFARFFMGRAQKKMNPNATSAWPPPNAPGAQTSPPHPFFMDAGPLGNSFINLLPDWVKNASQPMMPASVQQGNHSNPFLQPSQLALQFMAQAQVPQSVKDETWQILGHDASGNVRSAAASKMTSLDTLPAHTDLLSPNEKELFEQSLAILNSILQDKKGPLSPGEAATLRDEASNLERLNKVCESRLDALVADSAPGDQARIQSKYRNIDQFQSALQAAVRDATVSEEPRPTQPSGVTGDRSFDQSLDQIPRLLEQIPTDWNIIDEHLDNLDNRLRTFAGEQRDVANAARESVHALIRERRPSFREGLPPLRSSANLQGSPRMAPRVEIEDEDDIYSAPPRLKPPLENTRTRNFGQHSHYHTHSSTALPTPETRGPNPFASLATKPRPSLFSSSRRDNRQVESFPAPSAPNVTRKFGRSSVKSHSTISLPVQTGNETRRVVAAPPISTEETRGTFARLQEQEAETRPEGWTNAKMSEWSGSVMGAVHGDMDDFIPPSHTPAPTARDLLNPAEQKPSVADDAISAIGLPHKDDDAESVAISDISAPVQFKANGSGSAQ